MIGADITASCRAAPPTGGRRRRRLTYGPDSARMQIFFQTLVNGLTTGCLYALIALGYTMVYGVLKLLNFAHGDLYMVGAFIGYFVIQWFGGPHGARDPGAAAAGLHVRAGRPRLRRARRRDRALRLPAAAQRAADRAADHRARHLVHPRELGAAAVRRLLRSYNTSAFIPFSTGIHIGGVSIDSVQILMIVLSS